MRGSISLLVALFCTSQASLVSYGLRRNLGSKTPYYPQQSSSYSPAPVGCNAVHLNLVLRHGARNPGDDEIVGFNALAEKLSRVETLDDRYGWIKGWRFLVAVEDGGLLLPLGMREHYELGKRLRRLFPQAFPSYHPNVYSIRGTYKTRTGQSALSFAYGAFQGDGPLGEAGYMPVHMHMDSEKEDVQLRFLHLCEKYQTQVDTNVTAFAEYHDFLQGKEFQAVMKVIASRLSPSQPLSAEQQITPEDVLLAFEACAYDIILEDGNQDRWCSLFTPETVEIVNYALDLEDYIQRGYAYDITGKAAMMLLRDVVVDMDKFTNGEAKTQQWRFAHDSTILPFATLLGLFKDKASLTSDHVDPQRQFRTSNMIPFAANAVLALYECPAQDVPWRIKLLWNEQEMVIPGCEHDDPEQALYCDYRRFRSSYAEIVDEWKFEDVCGSQCACAWGQNS